MGILGEIESIKYKPIIDLINGNETYDKSKNSLTGLETFVLLHRRYLKLKGILSPLIDKIGKNIDVVDIDFVEGMQDETIISIKYVKNNKQQLLSISNFGFDQFEVVSSDKDIENEVFVQNNRKVFLNIFKAVDEYHLDSRVNISSTSKKIIVSDLADNFSVKDSEQKIFMVNTKHSLYEKKRLFINNISCNYPKLKELLEKEETVLNFYDHLRFYEEDISKVLIKKLV